MFYCVMKGVQPFAANFLSYILTKYYYNWSTSDLVIVKIKKVNFFLKHSVYIAAHPKPCIVFILIRPVYQSWCFVLYNTHFIVLACLHLY